MENEIKNLSNMIYEIARKFTSDEALICDLYQEAVIGILKAKKNFDPSAGTKFSSYARMYIYGEIFQYFNDNKDIKVNKDIIKMYKLIEKTRELLSQELKKEPTTGDISRYLKIDENIITKTILMMKKNLSLDYTYDEDSLSDYIGCKDLFENMELRELFSSLSSYEKEVMYHRYIEGYSQCETANIMNTSQSSISRAEKDSINKMRVREK